MAVYRGAGGVQYGMTMDRWEVDKRPETVERTHLAVASRPRLYAAVVYDPRYTFTVPEADAAPSPDSLINRRLPWLVFGKMLVTRTTIAEVSIADYNDGSSWLTVTTRGGVCQQLDAEPEWHRDPQLQALAADHFARLGRGDSIAHLLADWFLENGYPDMADVCRGC